MIRSLYVHIPFCERKCEYCDFVSVAGSAGSDAYMHALCAELRTLAERFPGVTIDTVFIGGGTPSLVDPAHIAAVLGAIRNGFRVAADAEITMEANPSSTTTVRAEQWLASGVNRVSLGVQSLHGPTLGYLGRVHDADRALAAVGEIRAAGFTSLNCDLIYAVPTLSDAEWNDTVQRTVAAGPDHISCYELTVEPGTPLHTRVARGLTAPVGDEVALGQHATAVALLGAAGLHQYEVSNFARRGHRCRHNLAYWHNEHYLAAGVGAHGHIPAAGAAALGIEPPDGAIAVRFWHGRGIGRFSAEAAGGGVPLAGWEPVTAADHEAERLMLGLRLTEGIELPPSPAGAELEAAGLIRRAGDRVRVTQRGEQVLNAVVERLTRKPAAAPCYA